MEKIDKIEELHELLFWYLYKKTEEDRNLKFSIRKSDKENRLSKGYYFYGNENYLAISFWSGTDWKNKTPNIIIVFIPEEEISYLEISVSDSADKMEFINQYFQIPELNLNQKNGKFYKELNGNSYINILDNFINYEKRIIDNIILTNQSFFREKDLENIIGFIDTDLFKIRLDKALQYRQNLLMKKVEDYPAYISQISIKDFCGIKEINIEDLPNNTQWIFLTGMNGSGKTSILRALTLALCPNVKEHKDYHDMSDFKIFISLHKGESKINILSEKDKLQLNNLYLSKGFAAYGPSRLIAGDLNTRNSLSEKELKRRQAPAYSIFHSDGILLEFASNINAMVRNTRDHIEREKFNIIRETLIECIEPLAKIEVTHIITKGAESDSTSVLYTEKDMFDNYFSPVIFSQISSGTKSLIAMLGDMMTRLFVQQPAVYDIAELEGIVLIDEIDIHFHPTQQKSLIETLTKSFPKIQFIATTHSPIPFLGAPKGSIIYTVNRTVQDGVTLKRLDDKIMLDKIMPNAILSSPIFGLDDLVPSAKDENEIPITEDDYNEIKLYEKLEKDVVSFLTNEKQKELIDLFKQKE